MPDTVSVESLRRAGSINLVDPNRPGWVMPLKSACFGPSVTIVQLPVDSTSDRAIKELRLQVTGLLASAH